MLEQTGGESRVEAAAVDAPAADPWFTGALFTALLIFTQLPGVLAYTIPLPLLAEMGKELSHDAASAYLVKLILGGIGPAMALGGVIGGALADRFDRRWLVMVIGTLFVLAALAPYVLGDLDAIVATRLCAGLTAGGLITIGVTMVGDYLPVDKRAGTIGLLSALNMVTSLVSMPAAGFVGEAGWRPAFLLYLAIAPVVLLAGPRPLPAPGKTKPAAAEAAPRSGLPWGLLLLALGFGVILTVPGIYVSFHLAGIGLGKTSTVALLMMINSLVAAVFSAIFGKATKRYSWRVIFSIAFSAMGAGLVVFAYASGIAVAIPALLLMGAGMGWLAPGLMAVAVDSVEEGRRGTIVGLVQAAMSVAPLLALSALEAFQVGTVGVMLLVGALSLALFLGYALMPGKGAAAEGVS